MRRCLLAVLLTGCQNTMSPHHWVDQYRWTALSAVNGSPHPMDITFYCTTHDHLAITDEEKHDAFIATHTKTNP